MAALTDEQIKELESLDEDVPCDGLMMDGGTCPTPATWLARSDLECGERNLPVCTYHAGITSQYIGLGIRCNFHNEMLGTIIDVIPWG